jgi:branched-chain amino acid transport system substrate-binding protein
MAVADFGGSVLGRPIEVMQADDQNKGDIAGALAREWVDDKGVDLLADGAATSAGLAIQQVARDKKRVFVMSTPTATAFIGKQCSPYGFQFAADTYALAKGVGGALAKAGGDTWFFITADYEFGASLQASTEEFVKAAGGKAAVLNATDSHPVAPRHAKPRLTESDWQQVAELVVSSHRE